jgi:hypothetical protein
MDIKQLLEKMDQFAGQAVGQKPGDQWKGTDKAPPGKKLVGDSILKDLSKGKKGKSKEQELSEEFQAFLEAEFKDTNDKRPGRKSDRHARGHEPQPRYKTVKANEGWNTGSDRVSLPDSPHTYWSGTGSLQKEYEALYDKLVPSQGAAETIEGEVLRAASKIVYRHYNDGDLFNQASFDQLEQYIGKVTGYDDLAHKATEYALKANGNYHPNQGWDSLDVMDYGPAEDDYEDEDEEDDWYDNEDEDNLEEAKHFKTAYGWAGGRNEKTGGTYKHPDQIKADREAKKDAKAQQSKDSFDNMFGGGNPAKGLGVKEGAEQDPIVAKVVKQMRPGLTGLNMGNEAFLYFAYELGKQRARDAWEDYLPAIRSAYEQGLSEGLENSNLQQLVNDFCNQHKGASQAVAVDAIDYLDKIGQLDNFIKATPYLQDIEELGEGWESGPEEYEEPYDDADDAYDRQRQEKIDTEAEKEWAKLPKVSTYKLVGRGPNMEPNYEFGDEFDTLEQAVEYRAEIMKDPKTPHPEHIGIRTITRVVDKEQTNEAVMGGGGVKDIEDYTAKRDYIYQQLADPKQVDNYAHFRQALYDLMRTARQQGIKIEESRAHKQLATWFKNREVAQKYASGDAKIPTPQERNDKIEKPKKQIKEFGADQPQGTAGQAMQQNDPKQAQAVAQATQAMKSATGSSAPTATLAKALDTASQGKPVAGQEAAALEPLMKDMATVAQDPKLAGSFKSLVSQINQAQTKQQQTT